METTTDEEGWVTGPALETVIALGGIRAGDMVRLQRLEETPGVSLRSGAEIEVEQVFGPEDQPLSLHAIWKPGQTAVAQFTVAGGGYSGSWWLVWEHVAAWKPKRKAG